jgi:hypothetical protein
MTEEALVTFFVHWHIIRREMVSFDDTNICGKEYTHERKESLFTHECLFIDFFFQNTVKSGMVGQECGR